MLARGRPQDIMRRRKQKTIGRVKWSPKYKEAMDLVELWVILKTIYEEHHYNGRQITQLQRQFYTGNIECKINRNYSRSLISLLRKEGSKKPGLGPEHQIPYQSRRCTSRVREGYSSHACTQYAKKRRRPHSIQTDKIYQRKVQ